MRRPLCMVCLVFVSVIFLCVHLWPPDSEGAAIGASEGEIIYLTGKVYQKEQRSSRFGSEYAVLFLNQITFYNKSGVKIQNQKSKQKKEKGAMCYLKNKTEAEVPLGSYVSIMGEMQEFLQATNPGEFDSREYYQILNLDFKVKEAEILGISIENNKFQELLYRIKEKGSDIFDSFFDAADAGIMKAILLGDKNDLEEEIEEQYRRNGILHIMSISGLHICMLGMGLYRLLGKCRLPLVAAGAVSVLFMWSYGIMTGMSTSSYRAIVMFAIKIAADILGRTYDMLTALSISAVLILTEQPLYVNHSGFLLSFGAVFGIGVILPILEEAGESQKGKEGAIGKWGKRGVFSGGAVFLATFPIQCCYYFQYPIYSIALNLLIVPLVGALMASGISVFFLAKIFPWAAKVAAGAGHIILQWYALCCYGAEQLPGAVWIMGKPGALQVTVYYAILFLALTAGRQCRKKSLQRIAICVGICAGVILLTLKDRRGLEITFLDVGQGDCIYIQSGSSSYLIDGGSTSRTQVGKYQITPFLKGKGIGQLEAVFITHGDSDHYSGIEELLEADGTDAIRISRLILPAVSDEACEKLALLARKREIPVFYAKAGDELLDGEIKMQCLNPEAMNKGEGTADKNEQSQVWLLSFRDFTALFTGDITGNQEYTMEKRTREVLEGKPLTILKVAHHGSMYSTREEFLEEAKPLYAVISCAEDNVYGHPHKELLERLEESGAFIWETRKKGAIRVWTDGKRVSLEGFLRQ